jgi:hypothetical protein
LVLLGALIAAARQCCLPHLTSSLSKPNSVSVNKSGDSSIDRSEIQLALGKLRGVLVLIGFTAVIAQVVLMRELMVVFYGNEMSLGWMLASWLLWTAIGSSDLGRLVTRVRQPHRKCSSPSLSPSPFSSCAPANLYFNRFRAKF